MNQYALRGGALLLALMLAGCQTSREQGSGVEPGASVTRFHLGQEIARGEIRVEPADPADSDSLAFAQVSAPIERELTRLGWRVAQGNARSEQVAVIRFAQTARPAGSRGPSLSIGVGGSTGGWRSGVGAGVSATVPVGGSSSEIVVSELGVRIQRRSDATVAWEGRAELEARGNSPLADRRAAVDRLATVLFQDFPGESGRTIRIR